MPPNCSRCAHWRICTWRGKNCCSWHRLSPGAKVADHGRAAQAGGRPEKTESERLHRPSRTLTTSKTRAYSEFPKMNGQQQSVVSAGQGKFEYEILRSSPWSSKTTWPHSPRCGFRATSKP